MRDGIDAARTIERFERRENKRFKRGGFGATEEFATWEAAQGLVDRLANHIAGRLQRRTKLNLLLRELDPHNLAAAALASLTHSALVGREDPELTLDIGRAVQSVAFETKVLIPEKMSRKVGKAAMEAGYRSEEWAVGETVDAGNFLLDCCLTALPDLFQLIRGSRGVLAVTVTEEKEELAVRLRERVMWTQPVLIPCKSPPQPWTDFRDGAVTFVSGAAANNKETKRAFQAALHDGGMKQHIDAVSTLEAVPYRINEPVLNAVRKYTPGLLEGKFRERERRLQHKKEKMAAAGASDNAMWWINKEIKECAKQLKQAKRQLKLDLSNAEHFNGAPFYLKLHCDFRGRVLPVPHFHFQREDHIRSLFLFHRTRSKKFWKSAAYRCPMTHRRPASSCMRWGKRSRRQLRTRSPVHGRQCNFSGA